MLTFGAGIETILEAPERWALRNGTRRVLLAQFPYAIVYREVSDGFEIVAVAHLRRRPTYWSKR